MISNPETQTILHTDTKLVETTEEQPQLRSSERAARLV